MIVEHLFHMKINEESNSANSILCDYFLKHKHQLKDLALKQVIHDTALSKSTIIRFFQHLGTANFTQFIYEYSSEINQRACRERVLVRDHLHSSIWEDEKQDEKFHQFLIEVAKGILTHKKLIIIGELRDVLLAEPYITHLFDLDITCDILWDKPDAQHVELPKDAYYLILMSHYTPMNFMVKANEMLVHQVKQILQGEGYEKGILSYPTQEKIMGTHLEISRSMRPMDKKILILTLLGELHNELLYGMSNT